MAGYTSRALAVERALYQLLDEQTWPAHPTTTDEPLVHLGGMTNPPNELICIAGAPPENPALDTATNRSKDEKFTLRVLIESFVPGRSPLEVSERLEELADVVQNALRTTGGALTNAFNGASPTHPVDGVIAWAVVGLRSRPYSTNEGAVGSVDIDIEFKTRL